MRNGRNLEIEKMIVTKGGALPSRSNFTSFVSSLSSPNRGLEFGLCKAIISFLEKSRFFLVQSTFFLAGVRIKKMKMKFATMSSIF